MPLREPPVAGAARIRPARPDDVPALTALYNHYVVDTPVTFDVAPVTEADRAAWLAGFRDTGPHRLLVAEEQGRAVGYACSRPFRPKAAYDTTVETSIYLAPDAVGRGLGARLYAALFEALAGEDLHRAIAGITLPNAGSVALHRRFGFEQVGLETEIGRKFGRYWDVAWFLRPMGGAG